MFKIGDHVVHQHSGVCKITDITKLNFNEEPRDYYIMYPVFENTHMKIVLPVDNCDDRINKVMSKEDAIVLIESIPNHHIKWIDNSKSRKTEYLNIISRGDVIKISSILKTIYQKNNEFKLAGKKLSLSDTSVLKVAEKKLYEELAICLELQFNEVKPYIDDYLTQTNFHN